MQPTRRPGAHPAAKGVTDRLQTVEAEDLPVLSDGNVSWGAVQTARRAILVGQDGRSDVPHEMPQRGERPKQVEHKCAGHNSKHGQRRRNQVRAHRTTTKRF